jgi:protein TonB
MDGLKAESKTVAGWKKKIVAQLITKRISPGATGGSGTVNVKFVIDRQGKLISSVVVDSTGSKLLDAAALAMVERAAPFPTFPAEVSAETLTFRVPIVFQGVDGGKWLEEWADEQTKGPAGATEDQTKLNAKIHGVCRGC